VERVREMAANDRNVPASGKMDDHNPTARLLLRPTVMTRRKLTWLRVDWSTFEHLSLSVSLPLYLSLNQ